MVRDFYMGLYTADPCSPCQARSLSFPRLSHDDLRWLNHEFSVPEIKVAIFQIRANKAPHQMG